MDKLGFVYRNRRARKYELAWLLAMVSFPSYGVPELGQFLPFIEKPWDRSFKQVPDIYICHCQKMLRSRLGKIKDAICDLLRSGSLPAPFGSFRQDRSFCPEFVSYPSSENP